MLKLFFFDTETTWLSAESNWIIQFSAIYWSYNNNTWEFHEERIINQYINTDFEISEWAFGAHWITKEFISQFWYIQDYIKEFVAYMMKSDYIIWHNVEFDMWMLQREIFRLNEQYKFNKINKFCTMKQTKDILKLQWKYWNKNPKLSELYNHCFNEYFENAHNSLADITATKKCFFHLLSKWLISI